MITRLRISTPTFAIPAGFVVLALFAVLAMARPAGAQSPAALPTTPGADRAVNGGLSEAHASLPGGPGLSPLEPYLVTWLLPISGILTVFAGIYVDRRVRSLGMRRGR